jgi:Zn-dependent protease
MAEVERSGPLAPRQLRGLSLGRILDIEIRLDWSVLIIFALIVTSLGSGAFPAWHPDWGPGITWSVAFLGGFLFFASLLAHELAHAIVAKRNGMRVPRITLYLFGGAAEIDADAPSPGVELRMAIAGPALSLVLGVAFTALAMGITGQRFADTIVTDPERALASLGPLATVLYWLGPVNIVLAVFNMIPGFPLDGGRVLRAVLWYFTKDQLKATRWAADAGRFFAWVLMGLGFLTLLRGAALQGLWFVLIGWFLSHIAQTSYAQLVAQSAIGRLKVRDLMRTRFETVEADVPLRRFAEDYLLRSGQTVWPVMANGECIGTASLTRLAGIPEDRRTTLTVRDIVEPLETTRLDVQTSGRDAYTRLLGQGDEPLPVFEAGHLVGFLHKTDILKWLALHGAKA